MKPSSWKGQAHGLRVVLALAVGAGVSKVQAQVPSAAPQRTVGSETASASIRWNAVARGLAADFGGAGSHGHAAGNGAAASDGHAASDGPVSGLGRVSGHGGADLPTKALAVLSAAQWAAVESVSAGSAAGMALAAGVASAEVLKHLYPRHSGPIAAELARERQEARTRGLSGPDGEEAEAAGRDAAARVIARAGSVESVKALAPAAGGGWRSAEGVKPIGATWGDTRPWVLSSASAARPMAPPEEGSAAFAAELEEVRKATAARTDAQLAIAVRWAVASMPEHWNATATRLLAEQDADERRAARTLAVLNIALMDANIACFEAKYTYWYIRPSQADPTIDVPVVLPNFPAYPSGHACVSGAAAKVLSEAFPANAAALNAEADEVAVSRLYAGVHYPIDNTTGLEMGRSIAELIVREVERAGIRAVLR